MPMKMLQVSILAKTSFIHKVSILVKELMMNDPCTPKIPCFCVGIWVELSTQVSVWCNRLS